MNKLQQLSSPVGTTLDRFIAQKQEEFPFASGELSQLLRDIALASKVINREINRAGLVGIEGSTGEENVQGESQQMLDAIADIRFTRALRRGGQTCGIVSEENDEMVDMGNRNGKYVLAIDPLDGSSNIDVNVSVGTIFSIYRRITELGSEPHLKDVLQQGSKQVAAGYVVYGSSTMLVYTTGHGVNGFTYDPSLGEYFLSHPHLEAPKNGTIFSINEGNFDQFPKGVQAYVNYCKSQNYTARYIGSLVADFHRNMLRGGVYLYPSSNKYSNGKLRLLYEANALAMLIEQAGGKATDGQQRILDIQPTDKHQRVPFFVGSANMVDKLHEFMEESPDFSREAFQEYH